MHLKTIIGREKKISSRSEQLLPALKKTWESWMPPADRLAMEDGWDYNLVAYPLLDPELRPLKDQTRNQNLIHKTECKNLFLGHLYLRSQVQCF